MDDYESLGQGVQVLRGLHPEVPEKGPVWATQATIGRGVPGIGNAEERWIEEGHLMADLVHMLIVISPKAVIDIERQLSALGLRAASIWAAEHAYIIYHRRFESMQLIGVHAAEIGDENVLLDRAEHSEFGWYPFHEALSMVHFIGLKDGLHSTCERITGVVAPARELLLLESET